MPGLLDGKNKAHQFFGCMRDSDIVMLALGPFLSEISSKGWVPKADILGGIVKSITQVSGASFLHVWIAVFQLPGLVSRR